jgi:signal transduction histidine kinase
MRLNSLSLRLILGAALWTVAAVVAAGVVLTSLYQRTVERTFDEQLDNYVNAIIGTMSVAGVQEVRIGDLGEPLLFGSIFSGWYWQISRGGEIIGTSPSLGPEVLTIPPDAPAPDDQGLVRFTGAGPTGEVIRAIATEISVPALGTLGFIVTGNATALAAEIATFRTSVILTLGVFGLALILSTFIQIRWGLRPLDRVRRGLADLRSGKASRLGGHYPAEIDPLKHELNALLESNQQVIERARTQVGNLAHALKTPLSVITNEVRANRSPLADKVCEQAELMRRQITHYLDRARIAARSDVIGAITEVEPVVARLARAMNRIYGDKGITVTADVPVETRFKGEQQDLEEIIGNLADNACKWAKSLVHIGVDVDIGTQCKLKINIDDDGPGLAPEQRQAATKRGRRLDESKPGSGLGLSIVTDLVGLYGGTFALDTAPTGGLRAAIVLPAVA